jgi:hypothetical protein
MFKKLKAEVIKYLCLQVSSDEQRNLIKEKFNNLTNKTRLYQKQLLSLLHPSFGQKDHLQCPIELRMQKL